MEDVDARDEPGHDDADRSASSENIYLPPGLFDQFFGGFRQKLVGRLAID